MKEYGGRRMEGKNRRRRFRRRRRREKRIKWKRKNNRANEGR